MAGAQLRAAIAAAAPMLRAADARFLALPRADAAYREYLITAHAVVRASVPLMHAALAQATERAHGDTVCAQLAAYLPAHIAEETDHDRWILEDLAHLGVAARTVLERPPSPRIAALVGAQYYWIHHFHPVALVGYMAALEGLPPSHASVERLRRRSGLDRRAFRTLLEHAALDQGHAEDIFRLVDRMELEPALAALVCASAAHTVAGTAAVMREVVDRCLPAHAS